MDEPSKLYTVLEENLPAANGIIHIIDRPIAVTLSNKQPRDEKVNRSLSLHRRVDQHPSSENVSMGTNQYLLTAVFVFCLSPVR